MLCLERSSIEKRSYWEEGWRGLEQQHSLIVVDGGAERFPPSQNGGWWNERVKMVVVVQE